MAFDEKPRWLYRFDNFQRAYDRLQEALKQAEEQGLTQLEKEGVIQRFEFTTELAWKTMKDYLEHQNLVLTQITPRTVVREAFAAKLIGDGQTWMDMLDARNKLSHMYDLAVFEQVIEDIRKHYWSVIKELYSVLLKYAREDKR